MPASTIGDARQAGSRRSCGRRTRGPAKLRDPSRAVEPTTGAGRAHPPVRRQHRAALLRSLSPASPAVDASIPTMTRAGRRRRRPHARGGRRAPRRVAEPTPARAPPEAHPRQGQGADRARRPEPAPLRLRHAVLARPREATRPPRRRIGTFDAEHACATPRKAWDLAGRHGTLARVPGLRGTTHRPRASSDPPERHVAGRHRPTGARHRRRPLDPEPHLGSRLRDRGCAARRRPDRPLLRAHVLGDRLHDRRGSRDARRDGAGRRTARVRDLHPHLPRAGIRAARTRDGVRRVRRARDRRGRGDLERVPRRGHRRTSADELRADVLLLLGRCAHRPPGVGTAPPATRSARRRRASSRRLAAGSGTRSTTS